LRSDQSRLRSLPPVTSDLSVSGVYADKVGIEAAEMLLRNIRHNGCVDEFLQDQVRLNTPDDDMPGVIGCDLTDPSSSSAYHLHGAGKGNVSDSDRRSDATHTDGYPHRRAAHSGQTPSNWVLKLLKLILKL
ncbi:hypothetical protein XENOCAPTIV_004486, partial [Xenoophorus captivus]